MLHARVEGERLERFRELFRSDEARAGVRNLLDDPHVLTMLGELASLVPEVSAWMVLGARPFVVRALLFDKTPDANWKVRWHRDRTIAARERREVPGFGPWTVKEGVAHAHAPRALLSRMLNLRIHLDDCGEANGPLRVIPGSHLDAEEGAVEGRPVQTIVARAGEVLAFRPLLLHASSPALTPTHRRVLQLELAVEQLPEPLAWRWRARLSLP